MTTREGTVTYRYDELHRLTEACWSPTSCPGGPPATPLACLACIGGLLTRPAPTTNPPPGETYRTYAYDAVGNRLTEVSNAGTTSYAYDNADRLTTVTPPGGGPTTYTFNNNGNQTAAGGNTFTYDYADRLKTATIGATTETYGYAGDGVRLSASTGALPSQTTKSLWDRGFGLPQLAIERDGSGALLRSYRYGLDLVNQVAGTNTKYYHHDGLGSVVDMTNPSASSLSWSEYYPYGQVRQAGIGAGAPAVNPFGFTGEQLDGFSGLYHLRARQYDSGTGRFLTTDPMAPQLTDSYVANYSYVRNNPCGATDPSGMEGQPPRQGRPPPRITWEPEYCDINVTVSTPLLPFVVTGGYMWDDAGGHPYLGVGIGSPSLSATCSNDSISPGLNWGIQLSLLYTVQVGENVFTGESYLEEGIGVPGASGTLFWVFD